MLLLDVNMPKQVRALLGELGIVAHTEEDRAWGGLTNGALVEAASQAGFRVMLTRDRLFSESAARSATALSGTLRCAGDHTPTARPRVSQSIPGRLEPQPNTPRCRTVVALARRLIQLFRSSWPDPADLERRFERLTRLCFVHGTSPQANSSSQKLIPL